MSSPYAQKHRDASYQQICAQIVREACDMPTLSGAASRALGHPDVCGDPTLASMVRAFIAEREAALRTEFRVAHPVVEDDSQLVTAFDATVRTGFPTKAELITVFRQHEQDFETHVAQYNETAATYALEKMQDLARRFPVHIDVGCVRAHEGRYAEFTGRCATTREQLAAVAGQAVAAAKAGDQKTASWLIRRLRAMHALLPYLLPHERFEELREQVARAGQQEEHREALRELIAREREVAGEIKRLGGVVYRFHKLQKNGDRASPEFQRAEAAYREAYEQVRQRDTSWLTGLLLELEAFLEDLNDPERKAQEQLDRFIGTVRTALNQLCLVIREIQRERAVGKKPAGGGNGST